LSPKHGVNPSLGICFYCGGEDGTVVLPGLLKGDAEAPRRACWTREPCEKCRGYMAQGVILISVRNGSPDRENPERTGRFFVVKEEAVRRFLREPALARVLKRRIAFMEDATLNALGFPEKAGAQA
jgi:hypothetical protein